VINFVVFLDPANGSHKICELRVANFEPLADSVPCG
jgi:hypothetical protein